MNYIDKDMLIKYLYSHGDENYTELAIKISDGKFDVTDYKQLCQSFIGENIENFFCNGFFGSRTFDLRGAEILRIFEEDQDTITIEVLKINDKHDYGYFNDGWNDWKTVYEHLEEWTNEEEEN